MLVIPIGLEENTVRRTPWVTWSLIGICCGVFLLLQIVPVGTTVEELNERYRETLHYLGEHPYLSVPAPIERALGEGGLRELAQLRQSQADSDSDLSKEQREAQQEQLDALSEQLQSALNSLPTHLLGFIPAEPRVHALITALFMHGGWFHLFGNMLFLFLSGPFVEDAFGRPLYAALYFLTGFAATAAHALSAPLSYAPLIGASGAIAGVMGAFLIRFGTRRIDFLVLPVVFIPTLRFRLRLPAFVVLPMWIGEQVLYATSIPAGEAGVAFWAHVGGFFAGVALALGVRLARVEERFINPAIESRISLAQHPGLERAMDGRTAGDLVTARREIAIVLAAEPQNPDAWQESWEIAIAEKSGASAGQAGLRLVDIHGRAGEVDLLWAVLGDPRWHGLPGLPVRFLLAAGDFLAREGDGRTAIECYRAASVAAPEDGLALRALVAEGEVLARAGDLQGARGAFDRARAHTACSELWVERMERALKPAPIAQRSSR